MKKSILTTAAFNLFVLTICLSGYCQTSFKKDLNDPKTLLALVRLSDPATYAKSDAAAITNVNAKALRDFKKTFKSINNEEWYEFSDGYLAEFTANHEKNSVVYDKKGNWKFTILYYSEKELPEDVRSAVKSIYYDYSITCVEEIHADTNPIYVVHMENETTWKNLRVCDGEIQVLEEFNKK